MNIAVAQRPSGPEDPRPSAADRLSTIVALVSPAPPAKAQSLDVDETIAGRYRVVRRLHHSAVSEVYEALDQKRSQPAALKILQPAQRETVTERRFIEEIRLLETLDHPRLVPLADSGLHDGRPFLVTPLVDGVDLETLLLPRPLKPDEARSIGSGVANALEYVHGRGIVHRDIKPGNILLSRAQDVFLIDFGAASAWDGPAFTSEDCVVGTAGYLSPEQAQGDGATTASDVYCLGLVLLEALTGKREYEGTPLERAIAVTTRPPRIPPALGAPWCRILRPMTAADPSVRPGIGEVRAVLDG